MYNSKFICFKLCRPSKEWCLFADFQFNSFLRPSVYPFLPRLYLASYLPHFESAEYLVCQLAQVYNISNSVAILSMLIESFDFNLLGICQDSNSLIATQKDLIFLVPLRYLELHYHSVTLCVSRFIIF